MFIEKKCGCSGETMTFSLFFGVFVFFVSKAENNIEIVFVKMSVIQKCSKHEI